MQLLRQKDLPDYRLFQLQLQGYRCALCGTVLSPSLAAMDHDHSTGHCRAVLCPMCNRREGSIAAWLKGVKCPPDEWIARLVEYWDKDYSDNPLYPTHPNDCTKKFSKLTKAQMINLLEEIYPEMSLSSLTKKQLAKLYRKSWNETTVTWAQG